MLACKVELNTALENFVKQCYTRIKQRITSSLSKKEFEGKELVTLVYTMNALQVELDEIKEWYLDAYNAVPGVTLLESFAAWYDKLVAADLKVVLNAWEHRSSEKDFPVLFFELYFAARRLWLWAETNLHEATIAKFRLSDYLEWFFPFVTSWLIQCKATALQMTRRSMETDELVRAQIFVERDMGFLIPIVQYPFSITRRTGMCFV